MTNYKDSEGTIQRNELYNNMINLSSKDLNAFLRHGDQMQVFSGWNSEL